MFVIFFFKAEAYIFTELFALKRATFNHVVIFFMKNIYVCNKVTTDIQEAFLKS